MNFAFFSKNQRIFPNDIVFQDKSQFTVYVICDVYWFIGFRDHRNTQDTYLCELSQFFNHLFFINIPDIKLRQKEETISLYAKLSYRENCFPEDYQFLLRFDMSNNISQFDSLQTRIVACVDKI